LLLRHLDCDKQPELPTTTWKSPNVGSPKMAIHSPLPLFETCSEAPGEFSPPVNTLPGASNSISATEI
jgi:hypothetical protein